jgi:hypothetical protein
MNRSALWFVREALSLAAIASLVWVVAKWTGFV